MSEASAVLVGRASGPDVWCVRAEAGRYTPAFVDGGFAAIGWLPERDLSSARDRDALRAHYAAFEVAVEPGFPRIGLIDGRKLVDLMVEHWNDIPEDFRDRLGRRPGLVPA